MLLPKIRFSYKQALPETMLIDSIQFNEIMCYLFELKTF